jgi:cytochrome oxidase assembly protein ShyY1
MNRWLTGQALGLGLIAAALIAAMVALGIWQLTIFDERQQAAGAERLEAAPIPLSDVFGPDDAFPADGQGQPVTVAGRYNVEDQVYVVGLPGNDSTYAVVTPLVTDNGSAILVVRGGSETPDAPTPTGHVQVTGVLQPSASEGAALDAERVTDGIRVARLVQHVSTDLYSGYVVLTSSQPPESLPPIDPAAPDPSVWVGLRNLAYALQWWVFAGFVAFMWVKVVAASDDRRTTSVG